MSRAANMMSLHGATRLPRGNVENVGTKGTCREEGQVLDRRSMLQLHDNLRPRQSLMMTLACCIQQSTALAAQGNRRCIGLVAKDCGACTEGDKHEATSDKCNEASMQPGKHEEARWLLASRPGVI